MDRLQGRRTLFRWMGWFALVNAVLLTVVGLRYFIGFSPGGTLLSWVYLLLVFPAHHILLASLSLFLLLTPLVILLPSRRLLTVLAVVLFSALIAISMLDSLLWSQSRFHLNGLTMQILGWQSGLFVGIIFMLGLVFESMLAVWVWRWVEQTRKRHGLVVGMVCLVMVLGSQLIHAWADATYNAPVTSVGVQLPIYQGLTANRMFSRLGLVDPAARREQMVARRLARQLDEGPGKLLNYPLAPLRCEPEKPMNLLLIVADAMRNDALGEINSPFLWNLASQQAQWFTQHYSGGNSSRMGMFSLFYGLPPGYWSSFESLQRSSVLLDQLQDMDYQLGLFSSATMYRPTSLDRTVFANVPDLRIQTEPADAPAWQKDEILTGEWKSWLKNRDTNRSFFGFLLYDSTNVYSFPDNMQGIAGLDVSGEQPWATSLSEYRKSVRYVDGLVQSVWEDLEVQGVADNTIVIFTSDHGEEFGESGQGLEKHGSGYTNYQLQVPMLVYWPGRPAMKYEHRSSHYDLVPTLMSELFACSNPVDDYSIGSSLFDGNSWDWIMAGSYYNYAVLEPDQITITYPSGRFEVRDREYKISTNPLIRGDVLEAVSAENSRFYRQ